MEAATEQDGEPHSARTLATPGRFDAPATGYYLAVFSLIPCIGLLLSIPAVILGIIGLKKAKLNPGSKGTAHAWTAIILGGLTTLLWIAPIVLAAFADRF